MPKVVGKMSTTDSDDIVAYGDNVSVSKEEKDPISKRIPQVFYSFTSSTKTSLYKTETDASNGESVSANTIPNKTIVYIISEETSYIKIATGTGLYTWKPIANTQSKIFASLAAAENYAATIGQVGEIITLVDDVQHEVTVYKIDIGNVLADVATSFLIQLYSVGETYYTLTAGQSQEIVFTFNEKYGTENLTEPGTVTYQIKRPSDATFKTIIATGLSYSVPCNGGDPEDSRYWVHFDPTRYGYSFENGVNILQVTVTGATSMKFRTLTYTFNVIDMYVTSDGFNSDVPKNLSAGSITYGYRCYGTDVNKTVFLKFTDDSTGAVKLYTNNVGQTTGAYNYFALSPSTAFPSTAAHPRSSWHGTYTIEQWCAITETIDTEDEIRSESIFFNILCYDVGNYQPLISATISSNSIRYGDNISVNYAVYKYIPSGDYTNNVDLKVYYYQRLIPANPNALGDNEFKVVADSVTPGAHEVRLSDCKAIYIDSQNVVQNIAPGEYVTRINYYESSSTFLNNAAKATWTIVDYPDTSIATTIFAELTSSFTTESDEVLTSRKFFPVTIEGISGDYNIDPIDTPPVVYFSSAGRSNNDVNKNEWTANLRGDPNFKAAATITNLNYINNGWMNDGEGQSFLRLSGQGKCRIPIVMSDNYVYYADSEHRLGTNDNIRTAGRTISIDFAIRDVTNATATCISWFSNLYNRGIKVTPQYAYLEADSYHPSVSSSGAITNKDSIPFVQIKDEERVELTIVIESENESVGLKYNDDGSINENDRHLYANFIRMYLNGEITKVISFTTYQFNQADLNPMIFGSNDAVIDIYGIRYYDKSLSDAEVLQNYISGRPTIKKRMEEYDKNAIYTQVGKWATGETLSQHNSRSSSGIAISYSKAVTRYPCFLITGQFSPKKGNKTKVGIIYTEPDGAGGFTTKINCMDYYTQGDSDSVNYLCETNVQGTSSQIYVIKNYKFKFTKLKTASYESLINYYVSVDGTDVYCAYKSLNFGEWYGPGVILEDGTYSPNTENTYWLYLNDVAATEDDTWSPNNTYAINDYAIYKHKLYRCKTACNIVGYVSDITDPTKPHTFVPYIDSADQNYLIENTAGEENQRYYFVGTGGNFYHRTDGSGNIDSTLAETVITDDKVTKENALISSDTTYGKTYHINIGVNDSIKTDKVKYKLFPDKQYSGKKESTICVKADYMSPDGINSDNGRMVATLFTEPVPPQSNNPNGPDDPDVFIAIPGFRALMFRRDTDTTDESQIKFVGRYNFNYDKGNTKSFGIEYDSDVEEDENGNELLKVKTIAQKWEFLNNLMPVCNFKSYKLMETIEVTDEETGETTYQKAAIASLESCYPDQGDLEDIARTPEYDDIQVLYSWVLQRANFWTASSSPVVTPYEYNSKYYYNEREYRKAIFVNEFEKHFNKNHVLTYFIVVETAALADNRAKNMFLTCFDLWHDTNKFGALRRAGTSAADAEVISRVDIKFTSSSISEVHDLVNEETGEFSYNLIDWENSTFPVWYTSLYDMDTCYGVENNGHNIYNYDVDVHEVYSYDDQGNPVYCFNGADSYLWNMVEEAFMTKASQSPYINNVTADTKLENITDLYGTLRSITNARLSYAILVDQYLTQGADTVPQVIYNEDQRFKYTDIAINQYKNIEGTYVSASNYIYLCQGSKRLHKKWFIENRLNYLDSKYKVTQYTGNEITFRINRGSATTVTPEEVSIDVTVFNTQYQYIDYVNTGFVGGKCLAGNTIHIKPTQGGVFQNAETHIYGASNICDLGDLSKLYLSKITLGSARRLKRLIAGSEAGSYRNSIDFDSSDLSFASCTCLQVLNLGNIATLSGEIDVSPCLQIQEIYAYGTNLNQILFPNGGSLRIVHLPTSTTTIKLQNQPYIEEFSLPDYSNLSSITFENCTSDGLNIPNIITSARNLKRARITGVNWQLDNKDVLNKLMSCGGFNAQGDEIDRCVLTGHIYVSDASSVNEAVWKDYWASAIADGSLTIDVQSTSDFNYVSYNKYSDIDGGAVAEFVNGYAKILSSSSDTSEDSSAFNWRCVTSGNEIYTRPGSGNEGYSPVLLMADGSPIKDSSNKNIVASESMIIKTDGSTSYWCKDGVVTSYSSSSYRLGMIINSNRDFGTINDIYKDQTGQIVFFDSIIRIRYWYIVTSSSVHSYRMNINDNGKFVRAVLVDNNDNIVYTAKHQLVGAQGSNELWYDTDDNENVQPARDPTKPSDSSDNTFSTTNYRAKLIVVDETIDTSFVDNGDDSVYNSDIPSAISAGTRFSHWSPSDKNVINNIETYAQYETAYDPSARTTVVLTPQTATTTNILDERNNIIGYRVVSIQTTYLGSQGYTDIVFPKEFNTTAGTYPILAVGPFLTNGFSVGSDSSIKRVWFANDSVVEEIGANAFSTCPGLEKISIPETVKTIGANAFNGITAEISWHGRPSIEEIGSFAFQNYNATGTNNSNMTILSQAQEDTIPNSIKKLGEDAFSGAKVNFICGANSVLEEIGTGALRNTIMTQCILPNTLVSIGERAFHSSTITSIALPGSLKSIGASAFENCASLATVTCNSTIDLNYIGDGRTIFNGTAFAGSYSDTTHDQSCWVSDNVTGGSVLYLTASSTNKYLLYADTGVTSVTIANGTNLIADSAFKNHTSLATLNFGSSVVKYINRYAFYGCTSMCVTGSISIPNTIKEIGEYAFAECANINSMTISGAGTSNNAYTIGYKAFANAGLSTITLNSGLTRIEDYAFYDCSMSAVALPATVEYIGDFVFNKCNSIASFSTPYIGRIKDNCYLVDGVEVHPGSYRTYESVFGYFFGYRIRPDAVNVGDVLNGRTLYFDSSLFSTINGGTADSEILKASITIGTGESATTRDLLVIGYSTTDGIYIAYKSSVDFDEYDQRTIIHSKNGATTNLSVTIPDYGYDFAVSSVNTINSNPFVIYNSEYVTIRNETGLPTPTQQYYNDGEDDYEYYYIPTNNMSVSITGYGDNQVVSYGQFYGCSNLTNLTLNNYVTRIEDKAFYGCSSFDNRSGATTVIDYSGLTALTSIGASAFENSGIKTLYLPSALTYIGDNAFKGSSSLAVLTIPTTVTYFGDGSLDDCTSLQFIRENNGPINYLSSQKDVANYSWAISVNSTSQTSYTLSVGCVGVYSKCFENCANAQTITVEANVALIGNGVFKGTNALRTISCNSNNTHFSTIVNGIDTGILYAIDNTRIPIEVVCVPANLQVNTGETIYLADTISVFRPYSCYGVKATARFAVPVNTNIDSFGDSAFYNCKGLQSINFSSMITSIPAYGFYGCENANIGFAGALSEIGAHAFEGCARLSGIALSNSITAIPERAFYGCTNLVGAGATLTIPAGVATIGADAFNGAGPTSSIVQIESGSVMTAIPNRAFAGIECETVVLGNKAETLGVECFAKSKITRITIPESITGIGNKAFMFCKEMTQVALGKGLTTIGSQAFYGCKTLATVNIDSANNGITLENSNAFVKNDPCRIFVVSSEQKITAYSEANNWGGYVYAFVDENTYNNGISTMEINVTSNNANPSIPLYKYSIEEEVEGQTIEKKLTSVVLWGDYTWHGPGNTTYWERVAPTGQPLQSAYDYYKKTITLYEVCTSTSTGALKIVSSGATTGQINRSVLVPKNTTVEDPNTNIDETTIPAVDTYVRVVDFFDINKTYNVGDSCRYAGMKFNCKKKIVAWDPANEATFEDTTNDDLFNVRYTLSTVGGVNSAATSTMNMCTNSSTAGITRSETSYMSYIVYNGVGGSTTSYVYPGYQTKNKSNYTIKILNRGDRDGGTYFYYGTMLSAPTYITGATVDAKVTTLNYALFNGATNATIINLPTKSSKYTAIGANFCNSCSNIETIELPDSIVTIGTNAFSWCTKLKNINISDIVNIGSSSFANCKAFTTLTFNKVRSFGAYAFSGCSAIKRVTIASELEEGQDVPTAYSSTF